MTNRFIFSLIFLLTSGNGFLQANIPHASIVAWMPGSHGNCRGIPQQRGALPIWVRINFDQKATDEFANKFSQFLTTSIDSVSGTRNRNAGRGVAGFFTLVLQPSITRDQVQQLIDKANRHFDPEYKTPEELVAIAAAEKMKQELATQVAEKRKQEEEQKQKQENALKAEQEQKLKLAALKPQSQDMLNCAITNDSEQEIKYAIQAGAKLNFVKSSQSPLLKAVLMRKTIAVKALLEAGANPNVTYLNNPLVHWAIKNGEMQIATLLVNAGADFSGTLNGEQDVFAYVADLYDFFVRPNWRFDFQLLSAMVVKGYNVRAHCNNKNPRKNALYFAIIHNKINHLVYLLSFDKHAKDEKYSSTNSVIANHTFVYPDGSTWTPLIIALERLKDHFKDHQRGYGIFGTLLENGKANPNLKSRPNGKNVQSPLSYILEHNLLGYGRCFNELIEKGANLGEAIDLFLKNGHSPNSEFDYGTKKVSLLGIAIQFKNVHAVKKLVAAKVDVNKLTASCIIPVKQANEEHTPLYFAFRQNGSEIAEILIENGARI